MNFRPTKWKLLISILVVIFWIMINYFALSDINCKMTGGWGFMEQIKFDLRFS